MQYAHSYSGTRVLCALGLSIMEKTHCYCINISWKWEGILKAVKTTCVMKNPHRVNKPTLTTLAVCLAGSTDSIYVVKKPEFGRDRAKVALGYVPYRPPLLEPWRPHLAQTGALTQSPQNCKRGWCMHHHLATLWVWLAQGSESRLGWLQMSNKLLKSSSQECMICFPLRCMFANGHTVSPWHPPDPNSLH